MEFSLVLSKEERRVLKSALIALLGDIVWATDHETKILGEIESRL